MCGGDAEGEHNDNDKIHCGWRLGSNVRVEDTVSLYFGDGLLLVGVGCRTAMNMLILPLSIYLCR